MGSEVFAMKKKYAKLFSFPADVLMKGPLISVFKSEGCTVSECRRIVEYGPEKIVIETGSGIIELYGSNFILREAGLDSFFVTGVIKSVFLRENG